MSSSVKSSDLIWANEIKGLATGISRVPLNISPKPTYPAKMVDSISKERKYTESPLTTGGFNFHGIPTSDSLAGTASPAPAPAGDR